VQDVAPFSEEEGYEIDGLLTKIKTLISNLGEYLLPSLCILFAKLPRNADGLLNDPSAPALPATRLAEWTATLENLRSRADQVPRYLICVVGATGAGKSSLINALLDAGEGGVVPTSGIRACTAVVTEIGYDLGSGRKREES
jgi:ribosome biogenesis GTPase A